MTESPDEAIKAIRDALEKGPTNGEWAAGNTDPLLFGAKRGNGTEPIGCVYGPAFAERSEYGRRTLATAAYIAACHPERIMALLDYVQGLEYAAKTARELLVENLAAFGPCDHDVGICNCDIKRGIDELNDALEAKG